ncbi:bacteriohemerythrin [Parasulfuritortus cantonensis]|uniref:histidine kinase n=1 Tax=Parasulfuritortus cantonensis TaxID=2528202 RepID=A0A4R1BGQ3_9PROT|nr:bacteriohemerythrin [Parasulfuritortus cantonensis]TCJ16371.1 bacteriohemerythrin [Parasulfuritortus cantonensis]
MSAAFVWDDRFVTGLELVDAQHRHLVDLVNETGEMLVRGDRDEAQANRIFGELADYARVHFATEEGLMRKRGIDPRHVREHTEHHHNFVEQVGLMWQRLDQSDDPAGMLQGFLSSWLTVHILGEDQVMARMMADIEAGLPAAEAYEKEYAAVDNSVSTLLDALHNLYSLLADKNRELDAANRELEAKVAERTRDLAEANRSLAAEGEELRHLLATVESAQRQQLAGEKLAAMGRMVAGLAHEMNTPLGIALGALSSGDDTVAALRGLLSREEVAEDELRAYIERLTEGNRLALTNLNRAAALVNRIRHTSVDLPGQTERVYLLADAIRETLLGWHPRLRDAGVAVAVTCAPDLAVSGDPLLVEQVLANLLQNSLEHGFYGRPGGAIRIEAAVEASGNCRIAYMDDGVGMPEDVIEHAFEPFYAARRHLGGAGLGLYFCYSIVSERLGGRIACTSRPGDGMRVDIEFPVHMRHPALEMTP